MITDAADDVASVFVYSGPEEKSIITGNTGSFTNEEYVFLNANGRQKLMYGYEDSTGKFSYLNGEILMDVNPVHDVERKNNALFDIENEETGIRNTINRLYALYPGIDVEGIKYSELSNEEWKVKNTCDSPDREMESLERERKSITRESLKYIDHPALSDAPGNLFIIHATDVTDTARMLLTKVNLSGKAFTETWTVKLPEFYRYPEKADSKGAFETVFSDGNPNFRYQWFELVDDKLFMISQLRIICIALKSGKTAWEHPL